MHGKIHTWNYLRGITTLWALSTEQGLTTEACTQLLDLASDSFANTQEEATL